MRCGSCRAVGSLPKWLAPAAWLNRQADNTSVLRVVSPGEFRCSIKAAQREEAYYGLHCKASQPSRPVLATAIEGPARYWRRHRHVMQLVDGRRWSDTADSLPAGRSASSQDGPRSQQVYPSVQAGLARVPQMLAKRTSNTLQTWEVRQGLGLGLKFTKSKLPSPKALERKASGSASDRLALDVC